MGISAFYKRLPYWIRSRTTPIRSKEVRQSLTGEEFRDAQRLDDIASRLEIDPAQVAQWVGRRMDARITYHVILDQLLIRQRKYRLAQERAANLDSEQGPSLLHMLAAHSLEKLRIVEQSEQSLRTLLQEHDAPVEEWRARILPKRPLAYLRRAA